MGQTSSGVSCTNVEGGEPVVAVEAPDEVPSSPLASPFPPPGKLVRVTVVGAKGVRSSDWFPGAGRNAAKADPYCIVEVPGKPKARFKTSVNENSLDPVWNHEHTVEEFASGDRLVFTVLDTDIRQPDDHLGRAQLTSARLKDLIFFDGELPLAGERAQEGSSIVIKVTLVDKEVALVNGKAGVNDQKVFDPGEDSEYKAAPDPMTVGPVILTKDQHSFGATLRRPSQKNILVVNSINEGSAWHAWNKAQIDDAQIKAGDRVLTVNNESGEAKMLFESINVAKNKDVKKLGMQIQRPAENRITVSKDDRNSLGLMLGSAGEEGFFVNEVQESGIIETQWNVHIDQPQKRVTEGDLLIAVNGVRGHAKGLMEEMNKPGKLVITFLTHYDPAYLGLRSSRRS